MQHLLLRRCVLWVVCLMYFLKTFKDFEKMLAFPQEDLAQKIGSARNTIARYESGEAPPSFEAIEKLSEALGLDETTLVTDPEVIRIWGKND